MMDAEVSKNLEAQMQAKLEKEERITRQQEEETNISLIKSWDNTQAMIDADYEKKYFEKLRAEKIRKLVKGSEKEAEGSDKEVEGSEKSEEGSSERVTWKIKQEDAKRQRLEEENESADLKRCLEIVPEDDDDVAIEATPLSSKSQPLLITRSIKKGGKAISRSSEKMEILKII
uniref:Uncharacterized protein n=1 Tax=Tanacetum cinerariifolium TaxID=118510 RepID=A0A6L2NCQ9_TANCI|nr:hypothetical protein [Tanacetum cinerariifolium]